MTSTLNRRDEAIRLLARGFAGEFAEFMAGDDRVHELMMELASEFVNEIIPIVDEEAATDVAAELIMSVSMSEVK